MVRRVTVAERRARLAVRHRLAPGAHAPEPVAVARALVALHATDPATVFLSAAARLREPPVAAVEEALYERRMLIRMLGMRRTMFVVPVELAPVVQAACTDAIAAVERRRLLQDLARCGVGDEAWLAEVEEATVAALVKRGTATAAQLAEDEPRLRSQLVMAEGKSYQAVTNVTGRVLFGLSARGRIVRGRPGGTWISTRYHWSPAERWLPPELPAPAAAAARTDLARRWLAAYGPATVADLKWWTSWTMTATRAALAGLETVAVDLDGQPGVLLAEDAEPVPEPEPWVALLPALDPTVMGWAAREWFLGPHGPALFDRTGNAGPTVWCDGRVVGGWGQRPDGRVVYRLLEQVSARTRAALDEAAGRRTEWLAGAVITPRFRTPLERELST
ncbi:winged helix DNA-binding domain-containing protein [Rhizomonospora bruguierae]|uniref:winged helix DNA-binding domain-containing protein n=1 Tax=Rhizomonospora bruguierae TaxID=1581705 RepID=UPI0020BF89F0|nr:winged helix DNA-binding domain-containing protein [Micromonospora sp. NBRC 107566]